MLHVTCIPVDVKYQYKNCKYFYICVAFQKEKGDVRFYGVDGTHF